MDIQKINQYKSVFDSIVHKILDDHNEEMEVWYARELQTVLGYARWENFAVAIGRAMESCKSQGINVDDHFREVTKWSVWEVALSGPSMIICLHGMHVI